GETEVLTGERPPCAHHLRSGLAQDHELPYVEAGHLLQVLHHVDVLVGHRLGRGREPCDGHRCRQNSRYPFHVSLLTLHGTPPPPLPVLRSPTYSPPHIPCTARRFFPLSRSWAVPASAGAANPAMPVVAARPPATRSMSPPSPSTVRPIGVRPYPCDN